MTDFVQLNFSKSEAIALDNGLSDLLCWTAGFVAARSGTDLHSEVPMGVEAMRRVREMLKAQIIKAGN